MINKNEFIAKLKRQAETLRISAQQKRLNAQLERARVLEKTADTLNDYADHLDMDTLELRTQIATLGSHGTDTPHKHIAKAIRYYFSILGMMELDQ